MDCSKTINFLPELKRLCDSRTACGAYAANEERCQMYDFCVLKCSKNYAEDAIKAVENLQKWSDKHPQKTYAQDFFEKFPKAQKNWDGTPFVCRKRIYGGIHSATSEDCDDTKACYRCWNEPMEE